MTIVTLFLIVAVVLFVVEAWRGKSLVAAGLACFAASFIAPLF